VSAIQQRIAVSPGTLRHLILEESKRANVGHIASALSIVEILSALYERVLRIDDPEDPDRDRFILGKGHAALALYAAIHLRGWIPRDELATYCADNTWLGVHPEHAVPGVDLATGSLGQGLSFGVGAALAARMQGSSRRVVVLISDAECNEGAVWEAAMFAAHHKLGNLTAIIDLNGQQALGHTADVLDLSPMTARWRAFGWEACEVDGHDVDALVAALATPANPVGVPRVVVARTVAGKGVSFMERQVCWHYLPMKDDHYTAALTEIGVDQ
jgi:transketolase